MINEAALPQIILRPGLEKKAYRLRCRFSIPAFPTERWLEKAVLTTGKVFIADLAKRGWIYLDKYGIKLSGPFPALTTVRLPPKAQQAPWQFSARRQGPGRHRILGQEPASFGVGAVPSLDAIGDWDYELSAVFVHKALQAEVPDDHPVLNKGGITTHG